MRYFFFKDSCEPKKIEFRLWGLFLKNHFSLKWHSFEMESKTWFMFQTFWVSRSIRKSGFVRCWQGTLNQQSHFNSNQLLTFYLLSSKILDHQKSSLQWGRWKIVESLGPLRSIKNVIWTSFSSVETIATVQMGSTTLNDFWMSSKQTTSWHHKLTFQLLH